MIKNLPPEFPIKKLDDFDFGCAEAKTDNLLDENICICWTRPIYEFVNGKKCIVIGERGSGKSVLFKLLSEGRLHFKKTKEEQYLIVPIEEELKYTTLRDYLEKYVITYIQDSSIRCRVIWELFVLSKILSAIVEKYSNSIPVLILSK